MLEKRIRRKISWEGGARCAESWTLGRVARGAPEGDSEQKFEGREVRVNVALWGRAPRQRREKQEDQKTRAHASRCLEKKAPVAGVEERGQGS